MKEKGKREVEKDKIGEERRVGEKLGKGGETGNKNTICITRKGYDSPSIGREGEEGEGGDGGRGPVGRGKGGSVMAPNNTTIVQNPSP